MICIGVGVVDQDLRRKRTGSKRDLSEPGSRQFLCADWTHNGARQSTTISIISVLVNKTADKAKVFIYDIDKDIVNARR
ncbi:hypothetical protein BG74_05475 [Sodalis-like endosymbiont of Proechinophthirus fluctus]|nr:hypothetical protein BG74_05475 [Sodalis-like endosymbiont of Proechinophthirus fluctus]